MVRLKHRYLLLNILYPVSSTDTPDNVRGSGLAFHAATPLYLDAGRFVGHLRNAISLLFGDFGIGASLSSLKVVYFSAATSTAIVRVPRNHYRLVWTALTHMNELPGAKKGESGRACVIRVVRVSGTIKKAEEELIRRARGEVVKAKLVAEGKEEDWSTGLKPRRPWQTERRTSIDAAAVAVAAIEDLSGSEEDDSH